jgi:RNA polymerase sigma-70 factor (ECF subfamily)
VNVYRSLARRNKAPEVPISDEQPLVGPIDTALEVETAQRDEMARRAVCSLPGKYRDALVLFYFHDLDVAEVGRVLGLPVGTVKARLHRGRAQLERRLRRILGPGVQAGVAKEAT